MTLELIYNGSASGSVAERFLRHGMNVNAMRPFIGDDGASYVNSYNEKGELYAARTHNLATLRPEQWKVFDDVVLEVAKPELRFFGDIRGAGLNRNIPNAFGKMVLAYDDSGDITEATISMDGMRRSESDRPEYSTKLFPLPIIHKDFGFTLRELEVSRSPGISGGATDLDLGMLRRSARRVSEEVEKLALGLRSTVSYGGGTIYGATNFPSRLTGDLSDPEGVGWSPEDTVNDVIAMRKQARDKFHKKPGWLYVSPDWDSYLDKDYSAVKGSNTLRERIMQINGILEIRSLDYLEGLQMIFIEKNDEVVRTITGMEMQTVQWDIQGGMGVEFKVMCILLMQFRADQNGNTGIVHRTVPAGT